MNDACLHDSVWPDVFHHLRQTFEPIADEENTSRTPRFLRPTSTLIQNFAPSPPPVPMVSPSTSLRSSRVTPMAAYTGRFATLALPHLHHDGIDESPRTPDPADDVTIPPSPQATLSVIRDTV